MGIVCDRGRYYWVKRVPKRFLGLVRGADGQPVKQVRQCLFTDSKSEASKKAEQVEAARMAEWEAMVAGDEVSARKHYEAARRLAEVRGFSYVPLSALTEGDITELVARVLSLSQNGTPAAPHVVEAVLGNVPEALPTLSEAWADYSRATESQRRHKSDIQEKRWQAIRDLSVSNFIKVHGSDPALDAITRADALRFRDWWAEKVAEGYSLSSANKQIGILSAIFHTWTDLHGHTMPNPFSRTQLRGTDKKRRPPFSRKWVKEKLLAPGALDRLNDEAADVLLVMINTGLGPGEVVDTPLSGWKLDHDIPHIAVTDEGRELKTDHRGRDIPLLGVSLAAARRIVARGGIQRYGQRSSQWSALVNKFLRNNGLAETPDHTAYSVRHYVEDELLTAGVDERVRVDILGHKYKRPKYGSGGGLEIRRAALEKIAL